MAPCPLLLAGKHCLRLLPSRASRWCRGFRRRSSASRYSPSRTTPRTSSRVSSPSSAYSLVTSASTAPSMAPSSSRALWRAFWPPGLHTLPHSWCRRTHHFLLKIFETIGFLIGGLLWALVILPRWRKKKENV
ncbi:hypothetical protein Cni_G07046 [Canna indica]|uniref:Uncharacterized protein n=1 Tax=Canna indica TaxID=4628 RepID=A0AAQ3Q6K1_9LILI|nr:hypothetical protein Cni_G07046 [Canna indica]